MSASSPARAELRPGGLNAAHQSIPTGVASAAGPLTLGLRLGRSPPARPHLWARWPSARSSARGVDAAPLANRCGCGLRPGALWPLARSSAEHRGPTLPYSAQALRHENSRNKAKPRLAHASVSPVALPSEAHPRTRAHDAVTAKLSTHTTMRALQPTDTLFSLLSLE